MGKRLGKRYKQWLEKIPPEKVGIEQAVGILKGFDSTKFDQSVEVVMHLGIDPRQADQAIRGSLSLPNGIGVTRKVIAFCEGADAEAAKEAGAIEASGQELIDKVQGGWMDFDVAIATPAMMRNVSRLGRVLGPQGKMPSPKAGTVTDDVAAVVKDFVAGKVEYRNDDGGNIHAMVGKLSIDAGKLLENVEAFIDHIKRLRPATTKGIYIKRVCLATTMSPAVRLDIG